LGNNEDLVETAIAMMVGIKIGHRFPAG